MSIPSQIGTAAAVRVAVDIGGTFTDIQVLDEDSGACFAHKVASRPDDPAAALIDGLQQAAERFGFDLSQVSMLIHGTTIATNAVLERKLPMGALVTTSGFEDVLEIGRHLRRDVYANRAESRSLLIPRSRRFGIVERIRADGSVEFEPKPDGLKDLANQIAESGAETLAVCCLNAHVNSDHERAIAAAIATEIPTLPISLSSDVSPEFREFERTSTTVLNALLMPVVGDYLIRLENLLRSQGLMAPVYLVQSNGGVATPTIAVGQPARLLLSGPSGGARAAEILAGTLGEKNLVAVDMGGTSYDISLVQDGRIRLINLGEVDGCPVRLPMVEMRTIGAGGGSLATTDDGQSLRVGPHSAGADPGPACYGRGGDRPTVTDANCHLGRIDASHFLGGTMTLHPTVAARALEKDVAEPLGMDLDTAADGVLRVAVSHMASAIRLSLFEKGLDPADFALVSFGGASGLHACDTATDLNIPTVIFPRDPGTLSAWGMLWSDITHNISRSMLMPACDDAEHQLAPVIAEMADQGHESLAADGIVASDHRIECELDLRYPGQAYEIAVPYRQEGGIGAALSAFHDAHQAQFSHCDETSPVDIVNVRMTAYGLLRKPAAAPAIAPTKVAQPNLRQVYLDGTWRDLLVYERQHLPDDDLIGPLIIEDPHSTLLIPTGWSLKLALAGEIIARYEGAEP